MVDIIDTKYYRVRDKDEPHKDDCLIRPRSSLLEELDSSGDENLVLILIISVKLVVRAIRPQMHIFNPLIICSCQAERCIGCTIWIILPYSSAKTMYRILSSNVLGTDMN
jgi:hypothetical protein